MLKRIFKNYNIPLIVVIITQITFSVLSIAKRINWAWWWRFSPTIALVVAIVVVAIYDMLHYVAFGD